MCSKLPLLQLRKHARVNLPAEREACKETTYAVITCLPYTYRVTIHNSCFCNELVALYNRHLVDRDYIPFDNALWLAALKFSEKILLDLECGWTNHWKIANSYSGGKRVQYLRACKWVDDEGYNRKDAVLKMFVKPDKYPEAEISSKPPRAIQYRTPKYNIMLASYLKDLEHKFYQVGTGPTGTTDTAKGWNVQERARILIEKTSYFKDPVFVNIDYSKMDSCVRVEHQVSIFRRIYLRKFPSRTLKQLLWAQLKNKGYSKHNIKYSMRGSRCSGDFTTGFENSIINWVILRYVAFVAGIVVELFIDGDDSIVVMERWDAESFQRVANELIPKLGFEAKYNWAEDIQKVDFCHTRLVFCEPPLMAREPIRAMSIFNISLKDYPAKVWPRLVQAKSMCERYGNPGSPILMPLGDKTRQFVKGCLLSPLFDKDSFDYIKVNKDVKFVPVTDTARQSYYDAWGISPYEQELIESDASLNIRYSGEYYQNVIEKYNTIDDRSDYSYFSG